MTKSNIIDLHVHIHHKTEKAVLVSDDGDEENAVWLPLSQVELEPRERTVTLPEWLAQDKGLI